MNSRSETAVSYLRYANDTLVEGTIATTNNPSYNMSRAEDLAVSYINRAIRLLEGTDEPTDLTLVETSDAD